MVTVDPLAGLSSVGASFAAPATDGAANARAAVAMATTSMLNPLPAQRTLDMRRPGGATNVKASSTE